MNQAEGRAAVARAWLSRAEECLDSAAAAVQAGHCFAAANRIYYAAFYAVTAALAVKGLSYHKHSAVRAALHREFIKPGLATTELGRLYNELFDARGLADYEVTAVIDLGQLRVRLDQVKVFVKEFRTLAGLQE